VFWVHYEDLLKNLELITKQLADFISIPLTVDELKRVCSFCTFDYMSNHADRFSTDPMAEQIARLMKQEKWQVTGSIVRKSGGRSGQGKEQLAANLKEVIDDLWQKIVTKQLGFSNYEEFRSEGAKCRNVLAKL